MATRLISSNQPGPGRPKEVCDFVLALAIAFNDFKSVLLLFSLHLSHPPKDRTHANQEGGQFGGIQVQIFRLLTGILWQLMELIQKHRNVLADKNFKRLLNRAGGKTLQAWKMIVDVANGRSKSPKDELTEFLLRVRNQAAFHYDAKSTGRAFRGAFASGGLPFVSIGENVAQSRFYFADRTAEYLIDEIIRDVRRSLGKKGDEAVGAFSLRHGRLFTDIGQALSKSSCISSKITAGGGRSANHVPYLVPRQRSARFQPQTGAPLGRHRNAYSLGPRRLKKTNSAVQISGGPGLQT